MLNANLIHNILNCAQGALGGALMASGCQMAVAGAMDCSHSFINPVYTGGAIAAIGGLKLLMNIIRDGFTGLVKVQPPVQ